MFVAAPYLAAFYNDPSMTPIFRGISLTVAVCGIKTIQQAHVTRNMKFQYFFYSAFAGAIVSTILGLGLAYMGFGVWALVVQQVSNITVDTLVLWKLSSWRPKMEFSWQHLKGLLSLWLEAAGLVAEQRHLQQPAQPDHRQDVHLGGSGVLQSGR